MSLFLCFWKKIVLCVFMHFFGRCLFEFWQYSWFYEVFVTLVQEISGKYSTFHSLLEYWFLLNLDQLKSCPSIEICRLDLDMAFGGGEGCLPDRCSCWMWELSCQTNQSHNLFPPIPTSSHKWVHCRPAVEQQNKIDVWITIVTLIKAFYKGAYLYLLL